ncbi:Gfo/Idh/MocA family protein [Embleya sp. NPDC008237]|uniref:Gfo/Idh/MocA family protein n=1 Tax=Embleya sp. NPDC008237 TaxID=3363978 RepID=UPI0036E7C26A
MARNKLGVAIVGTGFGCITHLPAFRDAGFEVRALVGRDPVRTAERAERFGVPYAFTDLDAALALDGVDAVTVATPPHTHAEIVLAAVAAGKHVVCEKPFASDANEAARMLAAAQQAGVVHMLGTEFRWQSSQALLARLIAAGAIGEPRLATWLLHIPVLTGPAAEVPAWWGRAEDGGGWLGAHASHWIDQIRHTLGEFAGVSAGLPLVADRPGQTAEDTFNIRFRTVTGVEGTLQSSAGIYGPPLMTTRVAGTHGTAWVEFDDVWLADASGDRRVETPADLVNPDPIAPPSDLMHTAYDLLHSMGIDRAPYTRLAAAFAALIDGDPAAEAPRHATFADGVAGQRVLDAVRASAAAGGRWVPCSR